MLALGIARHLGADDTPCVGLRRGPANPPETAAPGFRRGRRDALDLERAGARAVVRAHTGDDIERQEPAPPWRSTQNTGTGQRGREAASRRLWSFRIRIIRLLRIAIISFIKIVAENGRARGKLDRRRAAVC